MAKRANVHSSEGPGNQAETREELRAIKSLLMLLALKIGASTGELGAALGVTGARVRQMIRAGKIKKLKIERARTESSEPDAPQDGQPRVSEDCVDARATSV